MYRKGQFLEKVCLEGKAKGGRSGEEKRNACPWVRTQKGKVMDSGVGERGRGIEEVLVWVTSRFPLLLSERGK